MYTVVLALHIFVCFLLIVAVLLQTGKAGDIGAALGGGSGEMFGPKAPDNIMNKATTVIAACFLMLSLTLAILSGLGSNSLMRNVQSGLMQQQELPADHAPIEAPAKSGVVGQ